ncbi:MAG TPA: hypothetical protein VMW50_03215 [Dehalococcoidia bacterium]|nr:hypothetical protein [Dehalococcoidia bacterium]
MSEENPICRITKLEHPYTMPIDGDLQIGIEYNNTSVEGPTFYRTRKPGTWDFKMMADIPSHSPGELHGGHTYYAVPKGHLILQVEVGHGTWLNPIKITDTKMIIILHPDYPAPDPSDTKVIVDIVTPPKMWPVTQRFWAEPGSTIMAAWIYDNREGEHAWRVKYSRTTSVDIGVVPLDWVVNGAPFGSSSEVYEIAPGETHVIEVKASTPADYEPKLINFRVIPVNPELVTPI